MGIERRIVARRRPARKGGNSSDLERLFASELEFVYGGNLEGTWKEGNLDTHICLNGAPRGPRLFR